MKKNSAALIVFSLFVFISSAQAQEIISVSSVSDSLSQQQSSQDSFGIKITEHNQLIAKAGSVFTEHLEAGMTLPYLMTTPKTISYPGWAVRQGWHGKLVMALEILKDGSVGRIMVMQSTGHQLLDKTASEAMRSWKFSPALQNGKPALTCIQIPVVFELQQD